MLPADAQFAVYGGKHPFTVTVRCVQMNGTAEIEVGDARKFSDVGQQEVLVNAIDSEVSRYRGRSADCELRIDAMHRVFMGHTT